MYLPPFRRVLRLNLSFRPLEGAAVFELVATSVTAAIGFPLVALDVITPVT